AFSTRSTMTAPLSDDLKQHIISWYFDPDSPMTMDAIQQLAGCSIGAVYNTISNYQNYGQTSNPFPDRRGCPPTLTDDDSNFLLSLLEANPALYLDELQQRLMDIR
ncbi:hypothetical protein BJ165DRAFT_1332373, partial [Panaeolus papilionaceus]